MKVRNFLAVLALGLTTSASFAATITGAGASFPQPVYAKWATDYSKATGKQVNYQSIGSSGGINQIIAKTVDFGATDAPMTPADLAKNDLVQFPTVVGGVVPVINVAGVGAGQLKLSGPVLADIYLGKVTTWNDAAIQRLNPTLKLPAAKIIPVTRSDGSGTTYVFTNYLSQVSSDWKNKVGTDKTVKWPTAATGVSGKGNEGVAGLVRSVGNSIGYVEYAYAKQNKLAHTQLQNRARQFVQPDDSTFAAAANINWSQFPGFSVMITNMPTTNAWPISAATFILLPKNAADKTKSQEVIKFFDWALTNGNGQATSLDYVPLPAAAKAAVRNEWKKVN